jgi:imidazoleglycerol-phosphate dehydratase
VIRADTRTGEAERRTLETEVRASVRLDGGGEASVSSSVPFLDHMLHALSKHSRIDITVQARGDVEIDDHHTVEDVALTLGRALRGALGDRTGIARFGHAYAPLDEALARVVVDISGRPYAVYRAEGLGPYVGTFQTYLAGHFFRSLAQEAGMALHVELLYGSDPHHSIEAMFKALALALRSAVAVVGGGAPSTKGALD